MRGIRWRGVVDERAAPPLTPRGLCRPISNSKSRLPSSTGGSPNCAPPRARGRSISTPKSSKLDAKSSKLLRETYARLSPWQKTQVARHPERPHFKDYVAGIAEDFLPLAGDRAFGDDQAIIGGLARIDGRRVMLIGHEKGDDTASRLRHNFGMAKPEGYRKAIRLMALADRFGVPVVSLVDTSGAFPGVQAEERGQAEAIARSTEQCLALKVPMIAAVVGEGGSGGAIALAAANRVLMFEHAVYSVISPEGCASILWRTADKAADAAEAMRVTAQHARRAEGHRPHRPRAAGRRAPRPRGGDRVAQGGAGRGARPLRGDERRANCWTQRRDQIPLARRLGRSGTISMFAGWKGHVCLSPRR